MNTRKAVFVTLATASSLVFAGNTLAQAQDGPMGKRDWRGGPPGVEERLAFISKRLDLSDGQADQMLELMQSHEKERQALFEAQMAAMAPEYCAMKASHEADILEVLDDDQAAEFQAMKEQGRNRMDGRGRRGAQRGFEGIDCPSIDD